jgi:hypothetical protein
MLLSGFYLQLATVYLKEELILFYKEHSRCLNNTM